MSSLRASATPARLGVAVAVLVVLGTASLFLGPGRGAREDIAVQRDTVQAQLRELRDQESLIAQQLDTTRAQLDEIRKQRDIAEQQLALTRRSLELQEQTLETASQTLEVARQTLETARSIDRKTPPASTPSAPPPVGR